MKDVSGLVKSGVRLLALVIAMAGCGHKTPEERIAAAQRQQQQGDHKTAIVELKGVLQQQPGNGEARLLLAQSLYKTGDLASAEKELKKAGELGAPADKLIPLYGKVLLTLGNYQRVIDEIKPGPTLNAESLAAVQVNRFYAYQALRNKDEAMQALAEAEKARPDHPEIFLAKSRLALRDGNKDKALQWVDEALKRDPKLIDALYTKAALLGEAGKSDAAMKIYQQIVANDAKQIRAYLAMSSLHLQAKNLDAADQDIQAAEKINVNVPMVKLARGTLELRRGKLDKARSALLDVLRVAPNHLPTALAYATASYGLGNYEQSFKNAGKVLGAFPDNLVAGRILAGSQLKLGDVKGALQTLSPLLAKHPDDAGMLAIAGEAHLKAGDYNKAMDYLERAATLAPNNPTIKTRLAESHLSQGESDKALADLEQATHLSEKAGQADLALVMLQLQRKQFDPALQAIAALEKKLPNNPVTLNLRAAALLGKRDKAGARKALEQALALEPTFYPAAVNLARLDIQNNNPLAARKRFEAILEKDKGNLQAMLALADLAAAAKQEPEYVSWLEKAGKAQPASLTPKQRLIQYYLGKKDNKKAVSLAKEALSANQDNLEAINLLGATQAGIGDINGAIETFTRLTEKAKNSPDAYLHLATAQAVNKQFGPARASLERALQIEPDHIQSQDALLRIELAENKPDAALRIARQIQTQLPRSPIGFDREADILLSQKRAPQAIKAYELALNRGAGPATLGKLYRALSLAGDAKGADQRLQNWIRAHPEDINMRLFAAEQYLLAKRNREAIALYEEILRKSPSHVGALNNLANLYKREQDKRDLPTAEQAFKLAPQNPAVQDTLGWILVDRGPLPRALELLRAAASTLPKEGGVRYHYAVALAKSGKKSEARKELEAALAGDQKFPELEEAKALLKGL